MARHAGRRPFRRHHRTVFLSRRMDGGIRFVAAAAYAARAYFVLRTRLSQSHVCRYGGAARAAPIVPAGGIAWAACRRHHDADLLFSVRVAKADAPSVSHSRRRRNRGNRGDSRGMVEAMKLGLIAMSGVRAHNPELTALGLTLPGFVERNKVIASLPSLGLLTLAGMTPREVDLQYLEVPDIAACNGVPEEFDVVAISSFSAQIREAYELADRYRTLGTKVILGGLHVSAVPDEARAHADAVVIGEGEPAWPAVMADLRAGRLQPIYDARNLSFDLATAPMPRFELLEIERYNRLTVQTQRGCPFRCEFCAAS